MGSKAPRARAGRKVPSPALSAELPDTIPAKVYARGAFPRLAGSGTVKHRRLSILLLALALAMASLSVATSQASLPEVAPSAAITITLYGSATSPGNGWGFASTNITQPGPPLRGIRVGDVLTFNLYAADSQAHNLTIDLNGDDNWDPGEPASNTFSSPTTPVTFTWTADRAGTIQYICGIHTAALQRGNLEVQAAGGPAPADNTALIVGGVIVLVILVAVAMVMMRRRGPKTPQP